LAQFAPWTRLIWVTGRSLLPVLGCGTIIHALHYITLELFRVA